MLIKKIFFGKKVLAVAFVVMMAMSVFTVTASANSAVPTAKQDVYFYMDEDCTVETPMGQNCVYSSIYDGETVRLLLGPESYEEEIGWIDEFYTAESPSTNLVTWLPYFSQDGFSTVTFAADPVEDQDYCVKQAVIHTTALPMPAVIVYCKVYITE
jgi:hypothetical protein